MASQLQMKEVILISSFRNAADLNPLFKFGLILRLHKLMPPIRVPIVDKLVAFYLNSGNKASRRVLTKMIQSTDFRLMKWSLNCVADHKYQKKDLILHNIIGDADRIMSFWENETTYRIKNGSHFMVFVKAGAVTEIVKRIVRAGEDHKGRTG